MTLARPAPRTVSAIKVLLFVLLLLPWALLAYAALFDPASLGPNPAEYLTRSLGDWTLRYLLLTLTVTPARKLLGWPWLARLRRMFGLYAFFYALSHFACYVAFDHLFQLSEILQDVWKRPFITLGFVALLLLLPLAATSTNAMIRRLGSRRWIALHRLVYGIAILGVVHFWMMVKRDITEPLLYAFILAILLGSRVWFARRAATERSTAATGTAR